MVRFLAIILFLCGVQFGFAAERVSGTAKVIDGDGFILRDEEVRLWGVDAPEWPQQCVLDGERPFYPGREAKAWLSEHMSGRRVHCDIVRRDNYGRVLGVCFLDGEDTTINETLVRHGFAFDYGRYSENRYEHAEADARARHRGLWRFGAGMWRGRHAAMHADMHGRIPCTYPETYRHTQTE